MNKAFVTAEDFLEWAKENPEDFANFYSEYGIQYDVKEAEQDDFFGTEGFNKRFA